MIHTTKAKRDRFIESQSFAPHTVACIDQSISAIPFKRGKYFVYMDKIEEFFVRQLCAPDYKTWKCHGNCMEHWVCYFTGKKPYDS